MTALDAVNLLIAVNGSSAAKQAVDAVKSFSKLVLVSNAAHSDEDEWLADLDVNDPVDIAFRRGTSLPEAIAAIIQVHVPDAEGVAAADNYAEFTIDFVRPELKCEILFGNFSRSDDQELYQQGLFRAPSFITQPTAPPDKVDSTIISSRTLKAVGQVLAR